MPIIPLLNFKKEKHMTFKVIILSIIFASSMEVEQYIIPWRTFNIYNMVSNVFGVIIGIVFLK